MVPTWCDATLQPGLTSPHLLKCEATGQQKHNFDLHQPWVDLHEWCWRALADRKKKKTKIYTGVLKEPLPNVLRDTVRALGAGTHTHTHTPFLPCNIHQENAHWYATIGPSKVSTLPLCQLDYLFDQRGTWNAGGE